MSDYLKHECGIAFIRLLKPLAYYQEKYGSISIPSVHQHLNISETERDQWLTCMQESIEEQPYDSDFKEYLIKQL